MEFILIGRAHVVSLLACCIKNCVTTPYKLIADTISLSLELARFHFPPLAYVFTAIIVYIVFSILLTETIIGWCIGFVIWKLGLTRVWSVVEFRALRKEVIIKNFELGPEAIKSIYIYWKRILPLELLYAESSSIKLQFNIFKLGVKVSFVDLAVCFRLSHQQEWNNDLVWAKEIALGYKHRLANTFTSIIFDGVSSEPSVSLI